MKQRRENRPKVWAWRWAVYVFVLFTSILGPILASQHGGIIIRSASFMGALMLPVLFIFAAIVMWSRYCHKHRLKGNWHGYESNMFVILGLTLFLSAAGSIAGTFALIFEGSSTIPITIGLIIVGGLLFACMAFELAISRWWVDLEWWCPLQKFFAAWLIPPVLMTIIIAIFCFVRYVLWG